METNVNLGHTTDINGAWSGNGSVLTSADVGFWTKHASADGHVGKISFVVVPSLTAAAPSVASHTISAAHVAGDYRLTSEPFLFEGAKLVRNLNPNLIFVYLTPDYSNRDYPATDFGAGPITTLKDLAQTAPYREIFDMGFSTYVITIFPFASWTWINTVPRSAYPHAAADQAEVYDLVKYLLQTYQAAGKTFILKSWEGDWQIKEGFETHGIPSISQVQSYREWLTARHAGVVQARAEMGTVPGVQVLDGIELNHVEHTARDIPSILRDVVPYVASDYLTYTSYETINTTPTAQLRRKILGDVAFIRNFPGVGGRDLIVSEFAFTETAHADSGNRTDIASRALLDAAIPLAFYWQILDNECQNNQPSPPGTCPGFGLLRQDATPAPAWSALRTLLDVRNGGTLVSQNVPLAVEGGKGYPVSIAIKNTGNRPWDSANGYKLASQNPQDNTTWGMSRVALGSSEAILPGQTKTWSFTATAPITTGTYNFQWRMLQEGIESFGDSSENVAIFVMTPSSKTIEPASGGSMTFKSPAGEVYVDVPAEAFGESVRMTLQSPSRFPSAAASFGEIRGVGVGLEILLDLSLQPKKAIQISIPYRDSDVAGMDEGRLMLARYDTAENAWMPILSSKPDSFNNRVEAPTAHLSIFQVIQMNPSSHLSAAKAFPNPFKPSEGHTSITFSNLMAQARIRILTPSGALVRELSADAAGLASWDGSSSSGMALASGIYIVLVEGTSEKKAFQIAILR